MNNPPRKTEINPKWCNEWCNAWQVGGKGGKGRLSNTMPDKPSFCRCQGDYCKYYGHKGEPERLK